MLAGIGAVALAGAFVAPGVAAAAPSGSLGSLGSSGGEEATTATSDKFTIEGPRGDATVVGTGSDSCTATFTLESSEGTEDTSSWVVDVRVGDEKPWLANDDDFLSVYHPVVAHKDSSADALNETYGPEGKDELAWTVGAGEKTVDLSGFEGVEPAEDGSYTLTFKMYRGIPTGGWDSDNARQAGEITVTGCETTGGDDAGLGSLDLFGSLGSLFGTEK